MPRDEPPADLPVPERSPTGDQGVQAVVIGAGPAGLAVAACLRRAGVDFVLLEKETAVAASWRRHYDRLHLHTDKARSGLPGLPFPARAPRYPSRDEVIAYFEAYARHFALKPRFEEEVRRVVSQGERWHVHTGRRVYQARHVVLAVGHNAVPVMPTWPGLAEFRGSVLHSSGYRCGLPFRGARVLVVGAGNSGQEIVLDLLEYGAQVEWSVRGGVNVVARDPLGLPFLTFAVALAPLPPRLADALSFALRWPLARRARLGGLRPMAFGPFSQLRRGRVPMIDIGVTAALAAGRVRVCPEVARFEPAGAVLVNGRRLALDALVLATGFRPFPDLVEGGPHARLHRCGDHVSPTGMLRAIAREARGVAAHIARDQGEPRRNA